MCAILGTLKICDYGLSATITLSQRNTLTTGRGTYAFAAPENLRSGVKYGKPADVHSFGMVMYEVLARKVPYVTEDEYKSRPLAIPHAIIEGKRPSLFYIRDSTDPMVRDLTELMESCWRRNPDDRVSMPHVRSFLEEMEGRLQDD